MDLFKHLTPQTTLLTPNRRLSAALLKQHHAWQQAQGMTVWTSLDILPLSTWIQRLWQSWVSQADTLTPLLLTPNQEQILWEDILQQSAESAYLLQLSHTAELAKSAWSILKQWRVKLSNPALTTTEDGQIFYQWAHHFASLCEQKNWIDTGSAVDILIEKIETKAIPAPVHLFLKGFTEISPQYQALFNACEEQGTRITSHESTNSNHSIHRLSLHDKETEIRSMACWAKALYDENRQQTIGCIFPRLEKLRERVIQIFSDVFTEEHTFTLDHTQLPINISAGKSLSRYPVIHTALQLLGLQAQDITLESFSHLLHSPFLGEAEQEITERAQFDTVLRKANITTIKLQKLLTKSSAFSIEKYCPALAKRFETYLNIKTPKLALPSAWTEVFMAQLTALGWPGERSLNSQEYQVVDSWLKLLSEFAGLDAVLEPKNKQQALQYLTYLAIQKPFQPESPDAPIQILGLLEATELPFDHLWVMGLDDREWPPAPKPNPFIPQRLQKTLQMPHATAERELIYCQRLTTQLKESAKNIIFSHSQKEEDTELRGSPIIQSLPEIKLDDIRCSPFISPAEQVFASQSLESLQDELAPPVSATEKIRGGSSVFQLQANCPFKAFAVLRLHAKEMDEPVSGLKPQERGKLVHKALEIIWKQLIDSETLKQTDSPALLKLIEKAISDAISTLHSESLNQTRYRELEMSRLQKLLFLWLEQEKTRRDFKVIAQEEEHTVSLANLALTLRVDRIDQLDNGKTLIIDYKTGKNNAIKYWFGDRPEEPQLPLYCVTGPETTCGILFAQINAEDLGFVGISDLDLGIPSVKLLTKCKETQATHWQEQVHEWRTTLENLGQAFVAGDATVDPKDPIDTCNRCHLHALCRIHERSDA